MIQRLYSAPIKIYKDLSNHKEIMFIGKVLGFFGLDVGWIMGQKPWVGLGLLTISFLVTSQSPAPFSWKDELWASFLILIYWIFKLI